VNGDDSAQSLNQFLLDGLDEIFQRVTALEERRGLASLGFGPQPVLPGSQAQLDAKMALARWRIARLESFYETN
jgi:hypothetical protein